jgi:hypothetical protein
MYKQRLTFVLLFESQTLEIMTGCAANNLFVVYLSCLTLIRPPSFEVGYLLQLHRNHSPRSDVWHQLHTFRAVLVILILV